MNQIETERMYIRSMTMEDLSDLYEILGDDETMKNCEPAYDLEKTRAFLQSFCIEKKGALGAVNKHTGKMIGYILFREVCNGVYEMGWIFHRAFWRKGYAYESCKALIDHAFTEMNAHKIFAESIDSIKSVGLMQKLGMKLEGIQKAQTKDLDGRWADLYLYGLLQEDHTSQETINRT